MEPLQLGSMVFQGCAMRVVGAASLSVIHWAGLILLSHFCQGKQAGIDDVWELFEKQEELEWMKDDLAMHSRCLKRQMKIDFEVAMVVLRGGTQIDKDEEEQSAPVSTYHGMTKAR